MPSALNAELWECDTFHFILYDTGSYDIDILFCNGQHTKCQPCAGHSTHFRTWAVVLKPIEFHEVEHSTLLAGFEPTTPLYYMPSALNAELWECDTFHFILYDTGSYDIDILFCNGQHTKCQPCAGHSTHFRTWAVDLEPIEFHENSTLLVHSNPRPLDYMRILLLIHSHTSTVQSLNFGNG